MMRKIVTTALAAILLWPLAACERVPATGEETFTIMSPAEESRLGKAEHGKILAQFGGVYDDEDVTFQVARMGAVLAAHSELTGQKWTFTVLNSRVVNAFALPGGYVYITRGLMALAANEAELAGVLAHEIGHVTARHGAQRQTQAVGVGLLGVLATVLTGDEAVGRLGQVLGELYLASYSREQEHEADMLGQRYLGRSGYPRHAMTDFLERLEAHDKLQARIYGRDGSDPVESFFASHPRTEERIGRTAGAAGAANGEARIAREAYLQLIDGLIFGDAPEQGLVRDGSFIHPKLRFGFDLPQGFHVTNKPEAVIGDDGKGGIFVFDMERDERLARQARNLPLYMTEGWKTGLRLQDIRPLLINGLDAATATATATSQGKPVEVRLVAIRAEPDRIFRFLFIMPRDRAARLASEVAGSYSSFRLIGAREAAAVVPRRVKIVTVREGDTAQSLAARMDVGEFQRGWFELLNGLPAGGEVRPGDKVKLVVWER